ncbi:MAG: PH domain-containing protein [Acidobacteriota bacterium]
MPSDPLTADGALRRLPPISLVFNLFAALRGLVLPLVFVLFASGGLGMELWLVVLLLPAGASALLRYLTFGYRLGAEDLVIRKGLLTRNERHVPYARIQNVDLVQNPLHRWLDVAVVRLETASGGKPEAVISVLGLDQVEELRAHVFPDDRVSTRFADGDAAVEDLESVAADARRVPQAGARSSGRPLLDVPLRDLVLLGLISNRGMLVVAAAFGVLSQTGYFDQPERLESLMRWLPGTLEAYRPGALAPLQLALAGFVLVLLFLVVTRALSVAWTVFKLYGFHLERAGDDLRTRYGLLTRITATIPRHRIQLLSARLSVIHRWASRVSVKVETAGGGGGDDDKGQTSGAARLWLAPMVPRDTLPDLLRQVVPSLRLDAVRWRPLAPGARGRLTRRRMIPLTLLAALLGAGAVVGLGVTTGLVVGLGLALLTLLTLAVWWWAGRYLAHTAWALTDDAVLFRSGAFGLRVSVVPLAKIQVVHVAQTPFDRRARMARLVVDTAGASLRNHRVAIDLLAVDAARGLARHLEAEAARRSFRW